MYLQITPFQRPPSLGPLYVMVLSKTSATGHVVIWVCYGFRGGTDQHFHFNKEISYKRCHREKVVPVMGN